MSDDQRQTFTLDADGKLLTVEQDGISMPADHTFACVNDYVHDTGRHFEELQGLALGMACEIDQLRAEAEALWKDAERYRWLRDKGMHREIYADSAAVAPGLGPFIMIQFPSSGAPNRVALGSGADAYIDAAMAAKEA